MNANEGHNSIRLAKKRLNSTTLPATLPGGEGAGTPPAAGCLRWR